jgi:hypothetical protein
LRKGEIKNPLNTSTHRQCGICQVVKPLDDFYAAKRNRYGRNYQCKPCSMTYSRVFHFKKFGITEAEYWELWKKQDGKCRICTASFSSQHNGSTGRMRRLSIDHCHTTGKIRGLLCSKCNTGIGLFDDRPDLLSKAIEYLT